MSFLKNRTVIGVFCIVLSLIICFAITPLFNKEMNQKVEIIRVTTEIEKECELLIRGRLFLLMQKDQI